MSAKALASEAKHIAIVSIVVLVATSSIAVYIANFGQGNGLIYLVFMAGTVGGIANNFRRLQHLPLELPEEPPLAIQRLVTLQIYLSPVIGGVFGTVLYVVFLSGLLKGSVFPEAQGGDDPFTTTMNMADMLLPNTNDDAAKALLWAFVAGFAEQFVPNFIDKIAQEADQQAAAAAGARDSDAEDETA